MKSRSRKFSLLMGAALIAMQVNSDSLTAQRQDRATPPERRDVNAERILPLGESPQKEGRLAEAELVQNEKIAIDFVREHHGELEVFLEELKTKFPARYRRATAEIAREAKRLKDLQQRNERLYEFAIANWKLDSRAKLLAIRYSIEPTEEIKRELYNLVSEQLALQRRRAVEERDRLQARLNKLNEQIEEFDQTSNEVVEKRIEQVTKRAKGQLRKIRQQRQQQDDSDGGDGD